MESENNFIEKLVENCINIINKLFNLYLASALFFVVSEIIDKKILYVLSVIITTSLTIYIVRLSHGFYIKKDNKLFSLNSLGFCLCFFISAFFLSMTFSVSYIINAISMNL